MTGPRRDEITVIRSASDSTAAGSTEPSEWIGCPDISVGTSAPKRSRTVGATSVERT